MRGSGSGRGGVGGEVRRGLDRAKAQRRKGGREALCGEEAPVVGRGEAEGLAEALRPIGAKRAASLRLCAFARHRQVAAQARRVCSSALTGRPSSTSTVTGTDHSARAWASWAWFAERAAQTPRWGCGGAARGR